MVLLSAGIVGQVGNLPPIVDRRASGQENIGPVRIIENFSEPIANRPQVTNLPHKISMTDQEMIDYLRENGYPEHIIRAGPAGLIERWRKFVEEVERGYRSGLEDYRKALDIRGILALFELDDNVRDLDKRFEAPLIA